MPARPRLRILTVAMLVTGLCAACIAGVARITRVTYYPFYEPQLVQQQSANGEFPVLVVGNPFPDDGFLAQLSLPGFFPPARFVPVAMHQRRRGYLVFAFDPPRGAIDGKTACADPARLQAVERRDDLRLQAAFCFDKAPVTEAVLAVARPAAPTDPAFLNGMSQLMNELLPSRSPNRSDRRRRGGI